MQKKSKMETSAQASSETTKDTSSEITKDTSSDFTSPTEKPTPQAAPSNGNCHARRNRETKGLHRRISSPHQC